MPQAHSQVSTLTLSPTANITAIQHGTDKLLKGLSPREGAGYLVRAGETRIFVQALNKRFLNIYVDGLARFGHDVGGLLGFEAPDTQKAAEQACQDAKVRIVEQARLDHSKPSNREEQSI